MPNITVTIEPNKMGHYLVIPTKTFIARNKDRAHDDGYALKHGAYLQTGNEVEYLEQSISRRAWLELQRGFDVMCRVNDELALCWFHISW